MTTSALERSIKMFTFQTLGEAEQTLQKSRFIARAKRCDHERELALFLNGFAKDHAGAGHLAYAFRIQTPAGVVARFSDAGEPSGTAGKPILQMLEGKPYLNCCVAVIRYYGGINLGTGGLSRAYSGTAKLAMAQAISVPFVAMVELSLQVPYAAVDALTREISKLGGLVLDKQFDAAAHFIVRVPQESVSSLQSQFGQR